MSKICCYLSEKYNNSKWNSKQSTVNHNLIKFVLEFDTHCIYQLTADLSKPCWRKNHNKCKKWLFSIWFITQKLVTVDPTTSTGTLYRVFLMHASSEVYSVTLIFYKWTLQPPQAVYIHIPNVQRQQNDVNSIICAIFSYITSSSRLFWEISNFYWPV